MKKWIKYSLVVLVIATLTGGSWFTYTFFIKDYETADEEVDKIVDTEFDITLPDNENIISENEGSDKKQANGDSETPSNQESSKDDKSNEAEDSKDTSSKQNQVDSNRSTNKDTSSSQNSFNETTDKKNTETSHNRTESDETKEKKESDSQSETNQEEEKSNKTDENSPTVEDIKNRYRPSFQALQDQALAKLNNLVTYAYDEYKRKKKSGEKVSYGYFFKKYKSAAKELEAKTDATFQRLYSSLQQDLVENGFSKQDASDVKEYYKQRKESRESQMLSKVLENF
ncbi:hypothetical protein [Pontibacillus marinus]|uniref:Uncharacterized protein n=1 Tax=Pontibacillus marinus BH030004 = DSM 16465 TaxID=1385511 RepID=A0A0A5I611_9BACI|nr:hypothetical protein [Pontibacillus marinus]KGX91267.1 hypothetical protein N783_11165 [Pontibacillus marinus BH030004 = DSM 16465]